MFLNKSVRPYLVTCIGPQSSSVQRISLHLASVVEPGTSIQYLDTAQEHPAGDGTFSAFYFKDSQLIGTIVEKWQAPLGYLQHSTTVVMFT